MPATGAKNFLLRRFHFVRLARRLIVEPVQMQKPMDDVQLQLAQERIFKRACVTSCGVDTDENFAVLKGHYVSRPRLSEKLPMQKRHPSIGNQPDENFAQLAQVSSLALLQLQRMLHGVARELFEFGNID